MKSWEYCNFKIIKYLRQFVDKWLLLLQLPAISNAMNDEFSRAKKCNIITVYGPTIREDNRDLISFLETMIKKSTNCAPLRDVIQKTYLGGDIQDQNMENPRCKLEVYFDVLYKPTILFFIRLIFRKIISSDILINSIVFSQIHHDEPL